ncbi:MAG TPA: hypothetical protein PLZ08_09545 [Bacillota bacterium]|nr:hypothetical protein [Bacillota bacterium]HOL09725.1 hypothetical protein [Bacillota bacterium]HPO98182.1 hypothetical protein [Bacillota bacterium]
MTNKYDRFNQLVKTVAGSTTIINSYNGEGLREAKTVNGITTRYLYEYDKVILETDASGKNATARNIYGTNLLARLVENELYYYLYNGHADVTGLVNAATGSSWYWCKNCFKYAHFTGATLSTKYIFNDPLSKMDKSEIEQLHKNGKLYEYLDSLWEKGLLPLTFKRKS